MMEQPETPEQLATLLGGAAAEKKTISLAGSGSKCAMAGPLQSADVTISTSGLSRVVQYDPKDLTISVEAGLRIAELAQVLAEHRLMLPLDPPFFDQATVGGIVASNCSGPLAQILRHRPGSHHRHEVHHAGWQNHSVRRHGSKECRGP